ncbi:Protein translocase subunit SecD [Candidatus Syntrophocurvum alkaliphilum]|uniref:Protein translocase subunit SecD n=1 Tax=Candidatus Syntrophocurvum alkaliphilum TaxID=2293317 RepID=A0A6I6DFS1_9FIRM|nr:protein translocase subunit SecD [Candidatus Syntrophocurvum alkaliphilum]QGT99907.1 Protein translocase subunit SecD [Candidatus Syntrophocurvum alkaliphilum]
MKKSTSGLLAAVLIVVLGVLVYYTYEPVIEDVNLGLDLQGGLHVVLEAQEIEGQELQEDTITKSIGILRQRVDGLGVTEPNLYPQGDDRIVIELAGVDDPEEAVNILINTAQLEFWDEDGNVLLTGEHLTDARAAMQQGYNVAEVQLTFDDKGTELFAEATAANINQPLPIAIDEEVISSPIVNSVITDGRAVITGNFTADEAQELAVLLRSGALPVSFEILQKRTVGPTLGAESLESSLIAGLVGLIAVLIFMLGYYRLPGLIANLSLVVYILIVIAVMNSIGAVLTLPGILGLVLSIGMAVDANIIIYERLREELRHGKSLKAAIEAGYKRALSTILDANITTLIAALVLMYFGTGPIQGFAVTLTIGIITSLVVVLTFTRALLYLSGNISQNKKLYGV